MTIISFDHRNHNNNSLSLSKNIVTSTEIWVCLCEEWMSNREENYSNFSCGTLYLLFGEYFLFSLCVREKIQLPLLERILVSYESSREA